MTISYGGPLTIYGYTPNIRLQSSNTVILTNGISSSAAGSLDASSTVKIRASNIKLYNIDIKNTYGTGAQPVAVTANGDKLSFYGCGFYGYQDTLYVKTGNQYLSHCYVEGAVDYIFGAANVWLCVSTIASNGNGAITASSREINDATRYVFDSSTFQANSSYKTTGSVYLGRPWRVLAKVMVQKSKLSNIINAAGWTTMAAGATPVYQKYANTCDGASTSAQKYETKATAAVKLSDIFTGSYCDWIDCTY